MTGGHPFGERNIYVEAAGYQRARNYDASWNDWGNRDDTAIES